MDALADRARPISGLPFVARHPAAPRQHARPIVAAGKIGIGAVLGLCQRTIDVDPLAVRPLDILRGGEAAIDEMTIWQTTKALACCLQSWPQQAAIRAR